MRVHSSPPRGRWKNHQINNLEDRDSSQFALQHIKPRRRFPTNGIDLRAPLHADLALRERLAAGFWRIYPRRSLSGNPQLEASGVTRDPKSSAELDRSRASVASSRLNPRRAAISRESF